VSKALAKRGDTNHVRRIETALAAIQRSQDERAALSPAPEIFDLYCVCAVHDRPYTLRFVRQPSGLLRFTETLKDGPCSLPGNARAGGKGWALRLEYFEKGATRCAWCGDESFHHCRTYCGALVCGGRMVGETFHCRKSCGASWVGIPLHEVKGEAKAATKRLTEICTQRILSAPQGNAITRPRLLLPAAKTGGQ